MPELRHLLSPDDRQKMWSLKDDLKLLRAHPMHLPKGQFIRYLELTGKALAAEGEDHEFIEETLRRTAQAWKRVALQRKGLVRR